MTATAIQRPARERWAMRTGLLVGLALWVGLAAQVRAQDAGSYQVVGSVAGYLGTMPAEIVAGHPGGHPEARMHGGPPDSRHAEHIIVALFNDPSGTRIEDAKVSATISGLGNTAVTPVTLDPMLIAGVVTYGTYVTFPGRDTYTIKLQISRPGSAAVTEMSFAFEHGSG